MLNILFKIISYVIPFFILYIKSYFISLTACLFICWFIIKFCDRLSIKRKSQNFGKFIRSNLPLKMLNYLNVYLIPHLLDQLLVIFDIFCGFLEGLMDKTTFFINKDDIILLPKNQDNDYPLIKYDNFNSNISDNLDNNSNTNNEKDQLENNDSKIENSENNSNDQNNRINDSNNHDDQNIEILEKLNESNPKESSTQSFFPLPTNITMTSADPENDNSKLKIRNNILSYEDKKFLNESLLLNKIKNNKMEIKTNNVRVDISEDDNFDIDTENILDEDETIDDDYSDKPNKFYDSTEPIKRIKLGKIKTLIEKKGNRVKIGIKKNY
jgi:hypothetical protein